MAMDACAPAIPDGGGLHYHIGLEKLRLEVEQQDSCLGGPTIPVAPSHETQLQGASSESPFADPASSSGGDLSSDNSLDSQLQRQASTQLPVVVQHQLSSGGSESYPSCNPRACSLDGQPKSNQICFDYTKGLCTRGDKCKYSHDLATIVHFNSKEKGICFDYLRNQCHRGLLCRFSHDLSNIAQQCQASEMYNNAQVIKGRTNAICYDFVKGVCQRGSECRYSHDLSLIARTARGGQQSQKSGEICYDYLRGRCNRGTSCKYSHNISFLATPSFLSNALTTSAGGAPPGNPMAALPPTSASMGGALPSAMPLPPNLVGSMPSHRLSSSISADPLMLGSHTAPSSLQAALCTGMSPDLDGHHLNTALSSDLPETMSGKPEPPAWSMHSNGGLPPTTAHLQALAMAAQRRQLAAAAAVQLSGFNPLHAAAAQMGVPDVKGVSAAAGLGAANGMAAAQHQIASQLAARALLQSHSVSDAGSGPLHRANSAPLAQLPLGPGPVVPDSISALLANLGDNPQLLAETLSGLAAAAAQAQAHAAVRMSTPGLSHNGSLTMQQHSLPQPIPGRYESGSGVPSPPHMASFDTAGYPTPSLPGGVVLPPGAATGVPEHVARAAAVANNVNLSPDLLPLLKEIWNK